MAARAPSPPAEAEPQPEPTTDVLEEAALASSALKLGLMGFKDATANLQALQACGGDVGAAMALLSQVRGSSCDVAAPPGLEMPRAPPGFAPPGLRAAAPPGLEVQGLQVPPGLEGRGSPPGLAPPGLEMQRAPPGFEQPRLDSGFFGAAPVGLGMQAVSPPGLAPPGFVPDSTTTPPQSGFNTAVGDMHTTPITEGKREDRAQFADKKRSPLQLSSTAAAAAAAAALKPVVAAGPTGSRGFGSRRVLARAA